MKLLASGINTRKEKLCLMRTTWAPTTTNADAFLPIDRLFCAQHTTSQSSGMCRDDSAQQQQQHRSLSSRRTPRWKAFRIGKLHFGFHGLLGIASLLLTQVARQCQQHQKQIQMQQIQHSSSAVSTVIILAASQASSAVLVYHAANLLNQVPPFTTIFRGVTAPHKEAFRRTISAMQYLIVRVALKWMLQQQQPPATLGGWTLLMDYTPLVMLMWFFYPLIPSFNAEWLNGNTWIFVVPMFFGIGGDLYQYVAWGDCVTIEDLLLGQLLGLGLAFGFTLGFRQYVPMPAIYVAAAFAVWRIIREGIVAINECQAASIGY